MLFAGCRSIATMLFEGGFTFANFVTNLFSIFLFVLWLWLLMTGSRPSGRRIS